MKLAYFLAVLLGLILTFSPAAWCDESGIANSEDEFFYLWDKWNNNGDMSCNSSPMKTIPAGKKEKMSMKCLLGSKNNGKLEPKDCDCFSNKDAYLKVKKEVNGAGDMCICEFLNDGKFPVRYVKMEVCADKCND
uniref:Uncharacterized protein n=1 Tax=Picocystis salinarum TaxID=88271 RepID=A0A7S3XFX6_9CHLO|mmetsp:Transcript_2470/g.16461  ORF Transcript_2470/g.16461 Transcript_2470/m.16461 type:complete len:135 (-) Transcript_2470:224-628(-)